MLSFTASLFLHLYTTNTATISPNIRLDSSCNFIRLIFKADNNLLLIILRKLRFYSSVCITRTSDSQPEIFLMHVAKCTASVPLMASNKHYHQKLLAADIWDLPWVKKRAERHFFAFCWHLQNITYLNHDIPFGRKHILLHSLQRLLRYFGLEFRTRRACGHGYPHFMQC